MADDHQFVDPEINIPKIFRVFRQQWLMLILTMASGGMIGGVWTLLAQPVYRVQVILAPVTEDENRSVIGALQASLGGLAGLAGAFGGTGTASVNESIAIMKSRSFVEKFFVSEDLLPVLFASKWDKVAGGWQSKTPTLEDGYEKFMEDVFSVNEDKKTGLLTVSIEWHDRHLAVQWANKIVSQINQVIRDQAILQSNLTLDYLQEEIEKTEIVGLQAVMYSVVESELQKRALAKTRPEYAFRIIDPGMLPAIDRYIWPRPLFLVGSGVVLSGFLSICLIIWRHGLHRPNQREP